MPGSSLWTLGPNSQGHWQFPVVDCPHPPPSPQASVQIPCVGGVEREESRSIRAGYLPRSSIRTEIRVNCYGKGMLHSGASFILHLAPEMYVCFFLTVPFLLL